MKKKRASLLSRRAQDKLRAAIKDSRIEFEHSEGLRRTIHEQLGEAQSRITAQQVEQQALHDHIIVLKGDRDRLTAALEVCVRRLASPTADRDLSRGGWRGANQVLRHEQDQQAIDPAWLKQEAERDRALGRGATSRRG